MISEHDHCRAICEIRQAHPKTSTQRRRHNFITGATESEYSMSPFRLDDTEEQIGYYWCNGLDKKGGCSSKVQFLLKPPRPFIYLKRYRSMLKRQLPRLACLLLVLAIALMSTGPTRAQ